MQKETKKMNQEDGANAIVLVLIDYVPAVITTIIIDYALFSINTRVHTRKHSQMAFGRKIGVICGRRWNTNQQKMMYDTTYVDFYKVQMYKDRICPAYAMELDYLQKKSMCILVDTDDKLIRHNEPIYHEEEWSILKYVCQNQSAHDFKRCDGCGHGMCDDCFCKSKNILGWIGDLNHLFVFAEMRSRPQMPYFEYISPQYSKFEQLRYCIFCVEAVDSDTLATWQTMYRQFMC